MIYSWTVQKHQVCGYRYSQVCFHRRLFTNPVKLRLCITGSVGPLGSTNQNWWGAKLLPMAVLIYPVDCVYLWHLLRAQHHYLCPTGKENLPSALPTHPRYITPVILQGAVKNYLTNQQWILRGRVIYETLAITLFYIYSKFGAAIV